MVIKPSVTWDTIAARLEGFLSDISDWMNTNMLQINQDKIKLIIFSPKNKSGVFPETIVNALTQLSPMLR